MGEVYEELDWVPAGAPKVNLEFAGLRDDEEGFRILVEIRPAGFAQKLIVRFEKPYAYRNCDEGKRLRTMAEWQAGANGIFRVKNSQFAMWLHEESGYTGEMKLETYAIVTIDDWIEVIAVAPPTIVEGW